MRDQLGDAIQLLLASGSLAYWPSLSRPSRSRGLSDDGSGGTSLMIGLIAFAARAITRAVFVVGFGVRGEWR